MEKARLHTVVFLFFAQQIDGVVPTKRPRLGGEGDEEPAVPAKRCRPRGRRRRKGACAAEGDSAPQRVE